ncbi:MAG: extracellular solute-binding protein [Candidatus Sumerlaeaceae bacterium]|nr:extracellular solute-binding protein [Candidatus Sumerlaeaceae bacterium]
MAWFSAASLVADTPKTPTAGASRPPVTIQFWGLPENGLYQGLIRALSDFEAQHPAVKVERGSTGGQQAGMDPQKLMTSFVAGTPPDLVYMDRFELAGWAARGVFRPLDDLFESDKIDREDIYPACLGEVVYDGKIYGMPWNTDSRVLWVNMDILEKAGYTTPPGDWDELRTMAGKLTVRDSHGRIERVGFAPLIGNSWLYLFGWLNGGEYVSPDGRTITMTNPQVVGALEWMDGTYKSIGGYTAIGDFAASAQSEGVSDPFLAGKIVMKIDGNWNLDYVAKFKPDMNFRLVPPPAPRGHPSVSWSGGFCWSIPRNAPHLKEAWMLARFLSSEECWLKYGAYQEEANRRKAAAQGLKAGFYIPQLSSSKSVNKAQLAKFGATMPPRVREGFEVCVDTLNVCLNRPVIPVGRQLWDELARATDQVLSTGANAQAALETGQRRVQAELDRHYTPNPAPTFSMGKAVLAGFAIVMAGIFAVWGAAGARWHWTPRTRAEARAGLVFASPWLVGFFALMLGPMLASLIMSLSEYNVITSARWVGLGNFARMFGSTTTSDGASAPTDPLFWKSLKNTLFATAVGVPLGIVVSLGLALLVNKEVRGIRLYRTLFYLPVVVPAVSTAILWMWLLNNETGLTGALLSPILKWFGHEPISFFADPNYAGLGVVLMVTWGAGGSMVIWLAGLKGIPSTYYEAASIDGAGRISQFFRITLPLLSPYMFFNVIMGIIGWLQIFTQAYVIVVPPPYGPDDSLLYYVMYLFVHGFQYFNMGYACAMAWVLFVIVALLTLFQFKIAPRWVHYDQ